MYKHPYAIIKQKLLTVPAINEIAWYMEQDKKPGGIKISPTCLIRFMPTTMKSLGNGMQEGNLEFEVITITDNMYDNDQRIDDGTGTTHMDLFDAIHKTLSGKFGMLSEIPAFAALEGTANDVRIMNTIDRIHVSPPHDAGAKMRSVQRFKTYIKDPSGCAAFTAIAASLNIEQFEI